MEQQLTIPQAVELAERHLNAGDAASAEDLCRKVLQAVPKHPIALHMLAIISFQKGDANTAADLISQAVAVEPNFVEGHNNLGVALQNLGRYEEAAASLERALALQPEYAEACYILGNVFNDWGKPEKAIESFRKALTINPDFFQAHGNLGSVLHAQGDIEQALKSFERALDINPDDAVTLNNLGKAYMDLGDFEQALSCFDKALAGNPDFFQALTNKGLVFQSQGRTEEAVACYRRVIAAMPELAEAHFSLGNALKDMGDMVGAIASFQKALSVRPNYAEVHNNLGNILQNTGHFDEAVASYEKALEIDPDYAEAQGNLGLVFQEMGQTDKAIACYDQALSLDPASMNIHSNRLLAEQYRLGHDAESLYKLHCAWDRQHASAFRSDWPEYSNNPDKDRRLRIGFVSPDLGRHPVGYFVVRLFENLPKDRIETFVYSDRFTDAFAERMKETIDVWRFVSGISDDNLARTIMDDEIDILIDLAGHTGKRLQVFARKPAPVQVSWAGYVGTTGLAAIDYLLSDIYSTPEDEEKYYSEKVLRMPDGWLCYDPPDYAPEVGPPPFAKNSGVTFASFSNSPKLNDEVISLWARILTGLDDARLLLKYRGIDSEENTRRLTARFGEQGVEPNRIILEGRSPHAELLARYNDVDIALDPFPYSGGLTTYEALWMGVPVITLPGDTFASRHSLSHLSTLGHPELVAENEDDYVRLAIELAQDRDRLAGLRAGLRSTMAASPICDGKKFADAFAGQMRDIWRHWCGSQRAEG